jgi:hypothetical protein
MDSTFKQLQADILGSRTFGCTTVALADRVGQFSNSAAEIDAFVSSLGFKGISDRWQLVSISDANTILAHVLARDLAYNGPIMAESAAQSLSDRFLAFFDRDVLCFTNGTYHVPPVESSNAVQVRAGTDPISESTFDTGVVCLDTRRIGIVWMEDED